MKKIAIQAVLLSTMATQPVLAARETTTATINYLAIILFLIFVLMTLVITYVAAKHTHTRKEFYSAGNKITGWQNGIAMAGDFMSAASFLGISALVYTSGFDGLIYSLGFLVGWPIMMFLIAEPLRNLGRYTFADAACYRLKQKPIRCLSAIGSLLVIVLYLVAQMVGAGELIQLIFGINYYLALIIIGCLMVIYVLFGGMVATTWVQITKALLLLAGSSFMAFMVLKASGFSLNQLFTEAILIHPSKSAIMQPGELIKGPISALSLGLALMFGTAGLPHILMRFFTVSNAQEARKSVFWATGLMGYFYLLTFIIGFGAIVLLQGQPAFNDGNGHLIGGANMAAIHLANAIGGSTLLGLISATAFATILAVVAGLTLAGASSVSHDLYANVICKGKVNEQKEIKISKITVLCLGIIGILLGVIFKDQNIAYMVGLAFSIAASCNFPVLLLSLYWRNLTTRGATIGGALGLGSAVLLMIPAPTIWVQVLGHEQALFPYDYPALFSMPLCFAAIWFFSITDRSPQAMIDRQHFEKQRLQALTGIQLNNSEN